MRTINYVLVVVVSFSLTSGFTKKEQQLMEQRAKYRTWIGLDADMLLEQAGSPDKVENIPGGKLRSFSYKGAEFKRSNTFIAPTINTGTLTHTTGYSSMSLPSSTHYCWSNFIVDSNNKIVDWEYSNTTICVGFPAAEDKDPADYMENHKLVRDIKRKKYITPSAIKKIFTNSIVEGSYKKPPYFKRYYYDSGKVVELNSNRKMKTRVWRVSSDGLCEKWEKKKRSVTSLKIIKCRSVYP